MDVREFLKDEGYDPNSFARMAELILAQADVVDAARELIVCPSGVRVTTTPLRTALARLEAIEKEVCGD